MANAFKCDRCGRYHTNEPHRFKEVAYESWSGSIYRTYDFCDDCAEDFYEFCKGVPPKTLAEKLRAMLKKE
jgi:hypothetical protein